MDASAVANLGMFAIAACALLMALLFGSQYRGIVGWFRSRRKGKKAAGVSVANQQPLSVASSTPQKQPAERSVPHNVAVSQLLQERNQPRMARWALTLPVLLFSVSYLVLFGGLLTMMLGGIIPPLNPVFWAISTPLSFASVFCMVAANVSPLMVLLVSNIVLSLQELMR